MDHRTKNRNRAYRALNENNNPEEIARYENMLYLLQVTAGEFPIENLTWQVLVCALDCYPIAVLSMLERSGSEEICNYQRCFSCNAFVWLNLFKFAPGVYKKVCRFTCGEGLFLEIVRYYFGENLTHPLFVYYEHQRFQEFLEAVVKNFPMVLELSRVRGLLTQSDSCVMQQQPIVAAAASDVMDSQLSTLQSSSNVHDVDNWLSELLESPDYDLTQSDSCVVQQQPIVAAASDVMDTQMSTLQSSSNVHGADNWLSEFLESPDYDLTQSDSCVVQQQPIVAAAASDVMDTQMSTSQSSSNVHGADNWLLEFLESPDCDLSLVGKVCRYCDRVKDGLCKPCWQKDKANLHF